MILRVLAVIAVLIAAVLLYAATRPNTFRVQRSIDIQASPEKVFAMIDDFHNWPLWAPQDREDPTMRRTYSGPASGKDAVSEWSGTGPVRNGADVDHGIGSAGQSVGYCRLHPAIASAQPE
jgi:hypothetical protein